MKTSREEIAAVWNTVENARSYHRFAQQFGYYREMGQALAERARLSEATSVADLGCGTGVSTRALVQRVGFETPVIGVDPADAMLAIARAQTWPAPVRWVCGDASTLAEVAPPDGFARICCASAVWLEPDRDQLLNHVRVALQRQGLFVFSIPSEFVGESSHLLTPEALRFLDALQAVRYELNLDAAPGVPQADATSFSLTSWNRSFEKAGLEQVEVHPAEYHMSHREWLAHISIPAVLANHLPTATSRQKARFLSALEARLDPEAQVLRPWSILVARRP